MKMFYAIIIIILLLSVILILNSRAEGPLYKSKDVIAQQEFDNVYQDLRNLRNGTLSLSSATANFIQNRNTLQSGATFYVSSGTAMNLNSTTFFNSGTSGFGLSNSHGDQIEAYGPTSSVFRGQLSLYDTTTGHGAGVGGQVAFGGIYTGSSQTEFASIKGVKANGTDANLDGQVVVTARSNANGMQTVAIFDGNTQAGQIHGTTTNDTAASGYVGELINAARTTLVLSTVTVSIATITLTAGDWNISALIYSNNANGATNDLTFCISSTANSFSPCTLGLDETFALNDSNGHMGGSIPLKQVSIASSTQYFLVGQWSAGSLAQNVIGSIQARRIR